MAGAQYAAPCRKTGCCARQRVVTLSIGDPARLQRSSEIDATANYFSRNTCRTAAPESGCHRSHSEDDELRSALLLLRTTLLYRLPAGLVSAVTHEHPAGSRSHQ